MSIPISVLMPVYDGARWIRPAVEAVLRQSFREFELLVVDDGSTDDTLKRLYMIHDDRLRVVRNIENKGLVESLNRGLEEARGEFIARQDADDLSDSRRLERQLRVLRESQDVAVVGGEAMLIGAAGWPTGRWRCGHSHEELAWDLCFRSCFAHSSVMFRRGVIRNDFGGYRDLRACEDYDLWSRVAEKWRIACVPGLVVQYRLHGESIMAREGSSSASEEVARRNLAHTLDVEGERADVLVSAWRGVPTTGWPDAFALIGDLSREYEEKHGVRLDRVQGEELFTMYCRAADRASFRKAIADFPQLRSRMPWMRSQLLKFQ